MSFTGGSSRFSTPFREKILGWKSSARVRAWILSLGTWNDAGTWRDDKVWID